MSDDDSTKSTSKSKTQPEATQIPADPPTPTQLPAEPLPPGAVPAPQQEEAIELAAVRASSSQEWKPDEDSNENYSLRAGQVLVIPKVTADAMVAAGVATEYTQEEPEYPSEEGDEPQPAQA